MEASQAGCEDRNDRPWNLLYDSWYSRDTQKISRVISIVGRFLEHSRIYRFGTPEREKVYIASADYHDKKYASDVWRLQLRFWMIRCVHDWTEMFDTMMKDDEKGKELTSERYDYVDRKGQCRESWIPRKLFYEMAYKNAEKKTI